LHVTEQSNFSVFSKAAQCMEDRHYHNVLTYTVYAIKINDI
jgi:hypothetical protein